MQQLSELCAALERESGSAYLLSLELQLVHVNEGWRRFARANGAPELAAGFDSSRPVTDVCGEPLRTLYRAGFQRVQTTGAAWSQLYECSSISRYRRLNMRVDMTPQRDGFVVVHSLVVDAPLERESVHTDNMNDYTSSSGVIVQCANCRRVRRTHGDAWDWLPELLTTRPPNVSHGICASCDVLYYSVEPLVPPTTAAELPHQSWHL